MAYAKTNKERPESKGRRKIEIKKIEDKNSRQVTFSKRRCGLFKKACKLSILTGAEMAIIVQSPMGKVFTFGHPSADAVIDRYLTGKPSVQPQVCDYGEYNRQYLKLQEKLEAEKKRGEEIRKEGVLKNDNGGGFWWEKDVDGMGMEELEVFIKSLKELKRNVERKAYEKAMQNHIKNKEQTFAIRYGHF